jgi:hypothetical protein
MVAKFHERFEIEVGVQEARRRFAARVANLIFERFLTTHFKDQWTRYQTEKYIASVLGDRHSGHYLEALAGTADFHRHLHAVEALYDYLVRDAHYGNLERDALNGVVKEILEMSEVDIGVRWQAGRFIPEGARLLDDKLVNEPLRWLKSAGYENVLGPFQKGLQHLLQSQKTPALLSDVVTDMYEALEALAKVLTGRDADLSANQELLIKKVKASDGYKRLLKAYIEYANDYRHAAEQGTIRPTPSPAEAENFVYLTGTFIRLAMT